VAAGGGEATAAAGGGERRGCRPWLRRRPRAAAAIDTHCASVAAGGVDHGTVSRGTRDARTFAAPVDSSRGTTLEDPTCGCFAMRPSHTENTWMDDAGAST